MRWASSGRFLVSRREYVAVFGIGSVVDQRRLMDQVWGVLCRAGGTAADCKPVHVNQPNDRNAKHQTSKAQSGPVD